MPATTNSENNTRDQSKPRASLRSSRSANNAPVPAKHTAPATSGLMAPDCATRYATARIGTRWNSVV